MHIVYINVHKNFSTMIDRGLRKNIKIKTRRDGEIGKRKLNEMGHPNMKQKRWNEQEKSKRFSYSSVVFKDGFSLETHLEVWWKKVIPEHL